MTERDWLTSTDPAAMLAHVRDRATEQQLKAFIEYSQQLITGELRVKANLSYEVAISFALWEPEGTNLQASKCSAIRCIFGNPFRPVSVDKAARGGTTSGRGKVGRDDKPIDLTGLFRWDYGLIPALAASVYERECPCPKCRGKKRLIDAAGSLDDCGRCDGTGRVITTDPDWDVLPRCADALEEAGCGSLDLLMHLRGYERCGVCVGKGTTVEQNPYEYSAARGGHSDTQIEMCEACGGDRKMQEPGTGWRLLPEPKHVRGCRAVELLRGASHESLVS